MRIISYAGGITFEKDLSPKYLNRNGTMYFDDKKTLNSE